MGIRAFSIAMVVLLVPAGFALKLEYEAKKASLPSKRADNAYIHLKTATSLRFMVLGDSGSGDASQQAVADAMEAYCRENPMDALLHVGDVFYPSGVSSVDDPLWNTRVWDMYSGPCVGKLPIYSVFGNHDYQGNADAEIEMAFQNPRWVKPYRFYTRSFGDILMLVAIDGWLLDYCGDFSHCAIDHINFSLGRRHLPWQLAIGHFPIDSATTRRSRGYRGYLLEWLLCDKQVDAYFAGHNHHLEHREMPGCNPSLFISGGGGAALYEVDESDARAKFAASRHGFIDLLLTRSRMQTRFISSEGEVLYEYAKTK